jgi:hypothetical protein
MPEPPRWLDPIIEIFGALRDDAILHGGSLSISASGKRGVAPSDQRAGTIGLVADGVRWVPGASRSAGRRPRGRGSVQVREHAALIDDIDTLHGDSSVPVPALFALPSGLALATMG